MNFTGFLVAMVTDYVKVITKTYSAIITLSNDTMLWSLSDTECFYNAIKRQGFSNIENVGSHLKLSGWSLQLTGVDMYNFTIDEQKCSKVQNGLL